MPRPGDDARPPHHRPGGGFRTPWPAGERPEDRGPGALLRWMGERLRRGVPPDPPRGVLTAAQPRIARPWTEPGEARITWVGHATFLLQLGGANLLTDPHWSRRASPSQRIGPARLVPPAVRFDDLPGIDAVLLSHDHYDHLDEGTVVRLRDDFGEDVRWLTPLGYRGWFAKRGVEEVTERDWWEEAWIEGRTGRVRAVCVPVQHWSRRGLATNRRLWAGWVLIADEGEEGRERRIFFAGDSGYFDGLAEIGERLGPFDAALLPIGAYEPRWFMKPSHMNPEEAVRAWRDLGGRGLMVGMHWGTFRLTDEDPLEPPVRVGRAWREAGLPPKGLRILHHGETVVLPPAGGEETRQEGSG